MGIPSIGSQAALAMDAVLPFDGSSEAFEFVSENLRRVQTHVETAGIRGTRSRSKERVRIVTEQITGGITFNPSPAELDRLLPRVLGAAESSDVFNLADALPEFQVMLRRGPKAFTYAGCKVARAIFRGVSGSPLELRIELEGSTETVGDAATFPSITLDTETMYVFSDAALTLQSAAREFSRFELVIDNRLAADRWMNSTTRSSIVATDRAITLAVSAPFTHDETDLYAAALAGAAGTLAFANGNQSLTFTFANLKAQDESPVVAGKGEITLPLKLTAYKSGATPELVVTNDSSS